MAHTQAPALPQLPRLGYPLTQVTIPDPRPYNMPFVTSVGYTATVTPNCDTTDILVVGTLTGNVAIATPTGTPQDGQTLVIRFVQDATGGRTYTPSGGYSFGATYASASWATTANTAVEVEFRYDALSAKWRHIHFANF